MNAETANPLMFEEGKSVGDVLNGIFKMASFNRVANLAKKMGNVEILPETESLIFKKETSVSNKPEEKKLVEKLEPSFDLGKKEPVPPIVDETFSSDDEKKEEKSDKIPPFKSVPPEQTLDGLDNLSGVSSGGDDKPPSKGSSGGGSSGDGGGNDEDKPSSKKTFALIGIGFLALIALVLGFYNIEGVNVSQHSAAEALVSASTANTGVREVKGTVEDLKKDFNKVALLATTAAVKANNAVVTADKAEATAEKALAKTNESIANLKKKVVVTNVAKAKASSFQPKASVLVTEEKATASVSSTIPATSANQNPPETVLPTLATTSITIPAVKVNHKEIKIAESMCLIFIHGGQFSNGQPYKVVARNSEAECDAYSVEEIARLRGNSGVTN